LPQFKHVFIGRRSVYTWQLWEPYTGAKWVPWDRSPNGVSHLALL